MSYIGFIVLGLAAVMVSLQVFAWYSAKKSVGSEAPSLEEINVAESQQLLYFFNARCAACKAVTPIIETLKDERTDVSMINTDDHPQLANDYSVRGTPTLVSIANGKIAKVLIGAQSEKTIRSLLPQ